MPTATSAMIHATRRTSRSSGLSLRPDLLGERGDAAQLGVHPGREHHRVRVPGGARLAAEHQVGRVQEPAVADVGPGRAHDGHRLAGQRRRVDLDAALQEPRVGRDAIAFGDHQDVAGHELGRVDRLAPRTPDHRRARREVTAEELDRSLRLLLLHEREHRVEHDDRDDRSRDDA